jgi:hypothetical protein
MIAILFYAAVVLLVFAPALFPPEGMLIFGDDIHRRIRIFTAQFFNHWMRQGIFPWWNPYLFSGEPFIANPIVNIWYPPNWLYSVLPLNIAYSWHVALHVFWAMAGMYVLLRTNLVLRTKNLEQSMGQRAMNQERANAEKRSQFNALSSALYIPAWVGGLIFGLSGFFAARIWAGHVDVIAAASWMPWVVAAFAANLKSQISNLKFSEMLQDHKLRRGVVIAACMLAMQLFAGYQTMAFLTLEVVGVMIILYSFHYKSVRPFIVGSLGVLGGLGLAALQILPVQEFFRQSIRTYDMPYSWNSYGSLTWQSLIQFLSPFYFGEQTTYHGPPPNLPEHAGFVGIAGLVLAGIGMMRVLGGLVWKNREKTGQLKIGVVFIIVTVFGLWISLGPNAPVDMQYILWKFVPMYRYLRIPPRHLILVVFGLAGLAGLGMQSISSKLQVAKFIRFSIFAHLPARQDFRFILGIVVVIIVTEMVLFARQFIVLTEVPEARHDPELIAQLNHDDQPYRTLQNFGVWLPQRDLVDFDAVMSYGIFSATGYDPSILRPYYEFIANSTGTPGREAVLSQDVQIPYLTANEAETLDFLNVKYILVPLTHDPFAGNMRYKKIYTDASGTLLGYENTTVQSRYWLREQELVNREEITENREQKIENRGEEGGNVSVVSYTPNNVTLRIEALGDTWLNSSEVWYPGWEARVDGVRVPVRRYRDVFRSIPVPEGTHTVEYHYMPRMFILGAVVSIVSLLLLATAWIVETKGNQGHKGGDSHA